MSFVIRSYPRCGTHMLRTALSTHPEIVCHNEVFNPDVSGDALKELSAEELYARHTGPAEGFVVHGYTEIEKFAESHKTHELWPIIERERPQLLVIEREDLLRRAFSVCIARKTNRWHSWKTEQPKALISPELKKGDVRWHLQAAWESRLAGRRLFPWATFITYEQLVDDWDHRIVQIQQLCGATRILPIKPKTRKQDNRPINEMVSNYEFLRNEFKQTEYFQWFTLAERNTEQRAVG